MVLGDTIYGSRDNRRYLQDHGIRFAGKPLGRPKQVTEENQAELKREAAQRREEYLQRIPIEGKFGQGKNGYRLNYIRAKRSDTSAAWINSIFLVMNLLILLKIFYWLWEKVRDCARYCLSRLVEIGIGYRRYRVPHWRRTVSGPRAMAAF